MVGLSNSLDLPMFYINLEKRNKRREIIEDQIKMQNLNITRFSAIDGCSMKRQNFFLKKGQYGCFMSSYKLWEKVIDIGKTCVILEDDIIFCKNFKEKLSEILKDAKELDYDIILLSHNWFRAREKNVVTNYISTIGLFHGTQAYIITPKCAKYLCERFKDSSEWKKPLDVFLGELSVTKDIKLFATTEKIVTLHEISGGSDTNR